MPMHTCPVCGTGHWVHPVLHQLSYGRHKTCSPHCKCAWPAIVRARMLAQMAESGQHKQPQDKSTEDAACSSTVLLIKKASDWLT